MGLGQVLKLTAKEEKNMILKIGIMKHQIIWGGNYFDLPLINGWIVWDKDRQKETTFSDGELAWTSFLNLLKILKIKYDGFLGMDKDGRIHPTQKPIILYQKIFDLYAKDGDKILDTHGGSMSSVISCLKNGYEITCFELDKEYYESAKKRIEIYLSQGNLFIEKPEIKFIDNCSSV